MTTHEIPREAHYEIIEPLKGPETVEMKNHETIDSPLEHTVPDKLPTIVRHDQYHGIARVATRDLNQPGANFSNE